MLIRSIVTLLLILLFQVPAGTTTPVQQTLEACQRTNGQLRTQNQTLQASVGRLQTQLKTAQGELERCKDNASSSGNSAQLDSMQKRLNQANQQLAACQQENKGLIAANNDLRGKLDNIKSDSTISRQLAEKTQELEACNGRYRSLKADFDGMRNQYANFDQQLKASKDAAQMYKTENSQLSGQVQKFQLQLSDQENQLQTTKNELVASQASNADLTKQLLNRGQAPANPEGLMELAKSSQVQAAQSSTGVTVFEENGKVHVIRELVIGTLQTIYEKQVKPQAKFPLKAIFKPHPIITPGTLKQPASEESISWFIELQYPSQKSNVSYNQSQSGQKPTRRAIDPSGGEETWIWDVVPPANFESDVSDLIVFADYEIPPQTATQPNRKDIVHENIKFQQIVEPSTLSRGIVLLKENLSYLLGLIAVAVGIWGGFVKTKKDKLEFELKKKEQAVELKPEEPTQTT